MEANFSLVDRWIHTVNTSSPWRDWYWAPPKLAVVRTIGSHAYQVSITAPFLAYSTINYHHTLCWNSGRKTGVDIRHKNLPKNCMGAAMLLQCIIQRGSSSFDLSLNKYGTAHYCWVWLMQLHSTLLFSLHLNTSECTLEVRCYVLRY